MALSECSELFLKELDGRLRGLSEAMAVLAAHLLKSTDSSVALCEFSTLFLLEEPLALALA